MNVDVQIPNKIYDVLFAIGHVRYRVLYGGRGAGKSRGVADALLIKGIENKLRILCAREFQKSIETSVHALLKDRITEMGLDFFYTVTEKKITGKNGTEFGFEGLKFNISSIKSYEGADICWVEEAHCVSYASWAYLIPTIRNPNSEFWITYNPDLKTDYVHNRFVIDEPPASSIVAKVNWQDNPWFPDVLKTEMEEDRLKDQDKYLHVWEGHTQLALRGAIYAEQLKTAVAENRITKVPYNPAIPVMTSWDLGRGDATSIWFIQQLGFHYGIIDYYENSQHFVPHYLKVLQDKGYVYSIDYIPHDGNSKTMASDSIKSQMEKAGRKVVVVKRPTNKSGAIEGVRSMFSLFSFDEKKCIDGINVLSNYKYKYDEDKRVFSKNPDHNFASHGADALQTFVLGHKQRSETRKATHPTHRPTSWMEV